MSTTTSTASIDVDVPAKVAYDQWSKIEMFPAYFDDVSSVTAIGPSRHRWVTKIAGITRRFDSTVVEARRGERIAWRGDDGLDHEGSVQFDPTAPGTTTVTLQVELEAASGLERLAARAGLVRRRLRRSLAAFKQQAEARPTGTHLNARYDPVA